MAIYELKAKYRQPKTAGKYRSVTGRSGSSRKHVPMSTAELRAIQASQPKVTLVIGPTGKRTFIRDYSGVQKLNG